MPSKFSLSYILSEWTIEEASVTDDDGDPVILVILFHLGSFWGKEEGEHVFEECL